MTLRIRRDLVGGIILMIMSIIIWYIIPYNIVVDESTKEAQMFPRLIVGAMFILAFYITAKAIVSKRDVIIEFDLKKEGKICLYILAIILYVFLLGKIGFLISTLLIAALTLAVLKAKKIVYLHMAIFVTVIYFVFIYALGVPLP